MNQDEQHAVSALLKERDDLRAALATARASEREWCAKRCERMNGYGDFPDAKRFAKAIRALKDEPAQGEV